MSSDSSEAVDALMQQAIMSGYNKDRQGAPLRFAKNKDKLSKDERKIMKIMKKL